jgi:hypothetical protein
LVRTFVWTGEWLPATRPDVARASSRAGCAPSRRSPECSPGSSRNSVASSRSRS